MVGRDARFDGEETVNQLCGRHFQREEGDGLVEVDGGVAGHGEHERSLTHTGTRGQDHQIGLLPSAGLLVNGPDAARHPLQFLLRLADLGQLVQRAAHHIAKFLAVAVQVALHNRENFRLGLVEQFQDVAALVVRVGDDGVALPDELAQDELLHHDTGVILHIGGGVQPVGETRHVGCAARQFQLFVLLKLVGDGEHIDGLRSGEELAYRGKNLLVGLHIEHLRAQHRQHLGDGIVINHQSAEHGLLEFHGLRGKLAGGAQERIDAVV